MLSSLQIFPNSFSGKFSGNDNSNCNKSKKNYCSQATALYVDDREKNWIIKDKKKCSSKFKENTNDEPIEYRNDICSSEAIRKKLNRFVSDQLSKTLYF